MAKRLRIFAGPNGSGKSTLKDIISPLVKVGIYVNADDIMTNMRTTSRLEFSDYSLVVNNDLYEKEYARWAIPTNRDLWTFDNNGITLKDRAQVEDYFVSFLADFIRNSLLGVVDRFSFETVMSHPSKLDFIKKAKESGYKVYLYYVALPDPALNVLRVQSRVSAGGHDVDPGKVVARYERAMSLLADVVRMVDNAYFFDNSSSTPLLFARKENGELKTDGTFIPHWYQTHVLDKLREQ